MRETRTSGLMSGDGKQGDAEWLKPLRPSSTLPAIELYWSDCAERTCVGVARIAHFIWV